MLKLCGLRHDRVPRRATGRVQGECVSCRRCRSAFDFLAARTYTEFSGEGGLLPLHQKVLSVVRDSSRSSEALAILDIACGDGEPACSLAKQHPRASVRIELPESCSVP